MTSATLLRAFHAVATAGGYSSAAREIGVSQSTLSNQVRQLEAISGMSLFERTPRGVRKTFEGERLHDCTHRLFSCLVEADQILKTFNKQGGRIRICADGTVHALPILKEMKAQRPALTFSLNVQNSATVIDHVLQHRCDVGITAQEPQDKAIHSRLLSRMSIGLLAPCGHPWAGRAFVRLSELSGQNFILREKGSRTRAAFEQLLAGQDVHLGEITEISSREGLRDAVAEGFGLGITADLEFGHDSRLAFLPLEHAGAGISEYLICLDERRRQPIVAGFLRAAAQVF